MPIGQLYEVTFQCAIGSREFNNVFGYKMTAGTDDALVCQHLADTYSVDTLAAWQGVLAGDVNLQCVVARAITKDQAIPGVSNYANATFGLAGSLSIPAISAWVAKFITDNPLAVHNGRKFVPGMPTSFLVNGAVAAAPLAGALFVWATVHAGIRTVTVGGDEVFDPVIINRRALSLPIIPPTSSDVTSVEPLPTIYQQLGRKTKRTQVGF